MTAFYQLNKIVVFITALSLLSCGSTSEEIDDSELEVDSTEQLVETNEATSEVLFEGVFNSPGMLESREEMIEVLGRIGVHNYLGESFRYVHCEKIEDGFQQTCDYDFNGSINFLISGSETLTEYYDNFEPVFEHNSQDLFPYLVEDIYVSPADKELKLTTRSLQSANGTWGTDMALDPIYLTITENPDFGPIMEFNNRFYMREDFYNTIPAKECEPYEP